MCSKKFPWLILKQCYANLENNWSNSVGFWKHTVLFCTSPDIHHHLLLSVPRRIFGTPGSFVPYMWGAHLPHINPGRGRKGQLVAEDYYQWWLNCVLVDQFQILYWVTMTHSFRWWPVPVLARNVTYITSVPNCSRPKWRKIRHFGSKFAILGSKLVAGMVQMAEMAEGSGNTDNYIMFKPKLFCFKQAMQQFNSLEVRVVL